MRGDQNSDWWKQSGGRMIKTNRRRYLVALLALSVLALLALQNYDKRRCAEKRPATGSSARLQLQSNGSDCQRICGNVSIPYPFGLTPQCAYSSYFVLDCRTDLGPNLKQPATDPFEQWPVLTHIATTSTLNYSFEVNFLPVTQITSNSILIDTTNIKDMGCGKSVTASLVLDAQSPYWISDQNVFIVVSCNAQGSAVGDGTPWSGSFNTTCGPVSCVNQFVMPYCGGYDCCVQAIGATKSLTITGGSYSTDCGFSTVLNPNSSGDYGEGYYGVHVWYSIQRGPDIHNCSEAAKDSEKFECSMAANCTNFKNVGYYCSCVKKGYSGDSYKNDTGCEDINECEWGNDCLSLPHHYRNCNFTVSSYEALAPLTLH